MVHNCRSGGQIACMMAAVCLLSGAAAQAVNMLPDQSGGGSVGFAPFRLHRRSLKVDCFSGSFSNAPPMYSPDAQSTQYLCACVKQTKDGTAYQCSSSKASAEDAYAAATWTQSMINYANQGKTRANGYVVTCTDTIAPSVPGAAGAKCWNGTALVPIGTSTDGTAIPYISSLSCTINTPNSATCTTSSSSTGSGSIPPVDLAAFIKQYFSTIGR